MRCRPSIWVKPFSRLFVSYSIENSGIFVKTNRIAWWLSEKPDSMPLIDGKLSAHEIQDESLIGYIKGLFNIYHIKLISGSRELIWHNVGGASGKIRFINNYKAIEKTDPSRQEKTTEKEDTPEPPSEITYSIPNHAELSDKIILLPRPAKWLGYYQEKFVDEKGLLYKWINAGDILGYYKFPTSCSGLFESESQTHEEIAIKSPVSGIVLNPNSKFYSQGYDCNRTMPHLKVLLPEGESPIFPADDMYKEAYQAFLRNRDIILKTMKNTYFSKTLNQYYHGDLKDSEQFGKFLSSDFKEVPCEYIYHNVKDRYFLDFIDDMKERRPEYKDNLKKFDCAKIRFELALECFNKEDYFFAIQNFEKALPWHKDAIKHAESCFQQATFHEMHIENESKNETVGDMYEVKYAKELYEKSLTLNPSHIQAKDALERINKAIQENNIDIILQENQRRKEEKEDKKSTGYSETFNKKFFTEKHGMESLDEEEGSSKKGNFSDRSNKLGILIEKWGLNSNFTHHELSKRLIDLLEEPNTDAFQIHKEFLELKDYAA